MTRIFALILVLTLVSGGTAFAEKGVAVINGTSEGSSIYGKVVFEDTPEGLKIAAKVNGVSTGRHGFHIHQFGACGDMGKAAGDHYNPKGVGHGLLVRDGFEHAHAGDLGNIRAGEDGVGKLKTFIPGLTLSGGPHSVAGRSVILHERKDDFGQPAGNAGARVGCGRIVITGS